MNDNVTVHDVMLRMNEGERGGFMARIADAWFSADKSNKEKIEKTWWSEIAETHDLILEERIRKARD